MTSDLLDDLVQSLLNDPLPDESEPNWDDVVRRAVPALARRRRLRYRTLLVAAAAAAIVLVPTAVAFRDQISDLILGKPAPESIARGFAGWNTLQATPRSHATGARLFGGRGSQVDVSKAQGVVEFDTPGATVILWEAPQLSGGECWLFSIEKSGREAPRTFGSCDLQRSPSTPVGQVQWLETADLPGVVIVHARVYGATDVELEFADGTSQPMTVVAGHAVAAAASDSNPSAVVAKNANGVIIQTVPIHVSTFTPACRGICTGSSSGGGDFSFGSFTLHRHKP